MTLRFRISTSDLLTAGGIAMRPLEIDETGSLFERLGRPGFTERISHAELSELLKKPDTTYASGYFDLGSQNLRAKKPVGVIAELPDEVRRLVVWRKAFCDAFLQMENMHRISRTHQGYRKAYDHLRAEVRRRVGEDDEGRKGARPGSELTTRKLPGSRTALEWVRNYEKAGYSALALVPETHRSGNRKPRWCHLAEALMNRVIDFYADTQRPTKTQAVAATVALFVAENRRRTEAHCPELVIPSNESILRRLALGDPYYIHAKRYGTAAANAKFTLHENGPEAKLPLERVEMDENRLDVMSLLTLTGIWDHLPAERQANFESGRRWLYVAIDCATRCILSIRLAATPNADDAVRALRDIFVDKTPIARAAGCESTWHHHGGIGTIVTDQGPAFISDDFQSTVSSLGVTSHLPPAGLPWLRGHIESFFRTYGHQLMPLLIGRTFFDPVQRGDYPSEQLACLCDDDLIKILLTYVVDIYHNQPHGSLNGETPNRAWQRLVSQHGIPPLPDGLALRKAFGRPLSRKLRGDGILFAGLTYSCDALREAYLHSPERSVEFRVDLRDLGWVAVKLGATWYPAICNQNGFDGVSFEELREATSTLRTRHRRDANLDAPIVRRAIDRISDSNRQALLLAELTPFHVTDQDVERHQSALHYPLRSDADRLGVNEVNPDPLIGGIEIRSHAGNVAHHQHAGSPLKATPRRRQNRWRFDDEK